MPVVANPGSYQITAAFAGDEVVPAVVRLVAARRQQGRGDADGAAAQRGVRPASTSPGALGGTSAGLQQVPVAFTVNGPGGTTTVYAITDYLGNATFPPPSGLPAGQLHGDPGDLRRRRHVRADDDRLPDAAAGHGPEDESEHHVRRARQQDLRRSGLRRCSRRASLRASPCRSARAATARSQASTVHLTGPGSCTITADQAGDANYNPARQVSRSFSIVAAADGVVAGARRAESDDGRQRHLHADLQRSGHRRRGGQFRGDDRRASPRRRSARSAAAARRGR